MNSLPATVTFVDLKPPTGSFLGDVLAGLGQSPKALSPKYFYDARGCELFEAICELPEYYPTRTEMALMRAHAAEMAAQLDDNCVLIEFGSGAGIKTEELVRALRPAVYVPVDIAASALHASTARLAARFPDMPIIAVCADYMQPLHLHGLARFRKSQQVIYFPGSTIGNLTPGEAQEFLSGARVLVADGGAMLVGVDLKKDPEVLHAAYNDAQGVTAEFNLNLLHRINRELAADFDLAHFRHVAFYNALAGRIEMHLESLRAQTVTVSGRTFGFGAGERIHTENSCKYSVAEFQRLAQAAGFRPQKFWVDAGQQFAVHLMLV
ncbi:MAG: L-histidine N(alpha)-methyltransferase [Betaproteobacteria bacterium]|jgi:dimethylhistidine N-methyltransferase|nr:L-histidine N(alpha)-methyltransferase [Betaproteobacteria bacterium]MDH5341356.1 L-histidine N(alpha)-methyltransferase [Betaproteobacteria bacterium]